MEELSGSSHTARHISFLLCEGYQAAFCPSASGNASETNTRGKNGRCLKVVLEAEDEKT